LRLFWTVTLMFLFTLNLARCNTEWSMDDIIQVVYTSEAGPILPELQWHEQIIITAEKITLTRTGRTDETEINAGAWEFEADSAQVTALFATLQVIDCATLRRIEPDDPPDGGQAESYTLHYASGKMCSLTYNPGVAYLNDAAVVRPIIDFIEELALPAEAVHRY
jgi:hypothetical protein